MYSNSFSKSGRISHIIIKKSNFTRIQSKIRSANQIASTPRRSSHIMPDGKSNNQTSSVWPEDLSKQFKKVIWSALSHWSIPLAYADPLRK